MGKATRKRAQALRSGSSANAPKVTAQRTGGQKRAQSPAQENSRAPKRRRAAAPAGQPSRLGAAAALPRQAGKSSLAPVPKPSIQEDWGQAVLAEWGLDALLVLGCATPTRNPSGSMFAEATPVLPDSLYGSPLPSSVCLTLDASRLLAHWAHAPSSAQAAASVHQPSPKTAPGAAPSPASVQQAPPIRLRGLSDAEPSPQATPTSAPSSCPPTERLLRSRRGPARPREIEWPAGATKKSSKASKKPVHPRIRVLKREKAPPSTGRSSKTSAATSGGGS